MSRSRYALAANLYALVMASASTIAGVAGPHYIPIEPSEALRRLIHGHYVEHGSDQRSDWMANLAMLVPMGSLVAGWFVPGQVPPKSPCGYPGSNGSAPFRHG